MTITLDPNLEARFRARADAAGLTVDAWIARLLESEQSAVDEMECLALEGLDSGDAIEVGPDYWGLKHRQLDERMRKATTR